MAPSLKAEVKAAKKAGDELEEKIKKAEKPKNRVEEQLEQQVPPGFVKAVGDNLKPFSFYRYVQALRHDSYEEAKKIAPHEYAILEKYRDVLKETNSVVEQSAGVVGTQWLPTSFDTYEGRLTQNTKVEEAFNYVKAVFAATNPQSDPDEVKWLARQAAMGRPRYIKASSQFIKASNNTTSQSAFDDAIGGVFVQPPQQGEPIPLIRPRAAFLAAGAQAMTLPPQGRFVAPKTTSPPSVMAVGESQQFLTSQLGTDQMELIAKKIVGGVILTEEGTDFTNGTLDNIAQMELARSLGLKLDFFGFYGQGGSQIPNGITSTAYADTTTSTGTGVAGVINIESYWQTSGIKGIGSQGNRLLPQYGDFFPPIIEERSFDQDGNEGSWVMRPLAYASAMGLRGDSVTTGDQAGPMVDILRRFDAKGPLEWRGRRVIKTTNINGTETKGGSPANLQDVFYGLFNYALFASYGAIQFQQGHNGNTFQNGQVILRGTMYGDIGFWYPAAFMYYPNVIGINGQF